MPACSCLKSADYTWSDAVLQACWLCCLANRSGCTCRISWRNRRLVSASMQQFALQCFGQLGGLERGRTVDLPIISLLSLIFAGYQPVYVTGCLQCVADADLCSNKQTVVQAEQQWQQQQQQQTRHTFYLWSWSRL